MYCVVTNINEIPVQSDTITLSIEEPVSVLPWWVSQPESITVSYPGENVLVSAWANGDGISHKWYYKNPGQSEFKCGGNSSSMYVPVTEARDGRLMYCEATDRVGNTIRSDTIMLTIARDDFKVVHQPEDVEVHKPGQNATVSIDVVGEGLSYEWYYVNPGGSDFKFSGETGPSVTVPMTEKRNGRRMYCLVRNANGREIMSKVVTLRIADPLEIIEQPKDYEVPKAGGFLITRVVCKGSGLTYEWFYKNPGGTEFRPTGEHDRITTTEMTEKRNGRQVYCVITDKYGDTVTSNIATLTIKK